MLEVLLAMTIIVIGLTAVIGVNVTALEALRASEDKVTAMMLLEGELVLLRSQSALQGGLNAGRWSGELEGFKDGQWTAEAVEETDSTALTLQGRWSRSGRIRSVSFITKTAAPPPESP
ncbi:MAG: hypothetical protein HY594_04070 [Candidatus Omnitrophica bacterium]|nr:hypothetical protein [Candidatus Omnitrophota bacterium]